MIYLSFILCICLSVCCLSVSLSDFLLEYLISDCNLLVCPSAWPTSDCLSQWLTVWQSYFLLCVTTQTYRLSVSVTYMTCVKTLLCLIRTCPGFFIALRNLILTLWSDNCKVRHQTMFPNTSKVKVTRKVSHLQSSEFLNFTLIFVNNGRWDLSKCCFTFTRW